MTAEELFREWRKSLRVGDRVMHARGAATLGSVTALDSFGPYNIEVKWDDEGTTCPSYRANLLPACPRCLEQTRSVSIAEAERDANRAGWSCAETALAQAVKRFSSAEDALREARKLLEAR